MTPRADILSAYARPARMTDPGARATLFAGLPTDIDALAGVIQGLLLHEHWSPAYGVTLTDERRREVHTRPTSAMLDVIAAHDPRPLTETRPLEDRTIGNCRHFSVLMTATLRAQGIPARARCGFATYFDPVMGVDHWVCEYWNAGQGRWVLVDAQIDEFQAGKIKPDFDLLDVPRDRFVIAGDAWRQCRAGKADPDRFGIMHMKGLWFVAGNVIRDAAALANMEMLPWDVWGAMTQPGEPIDDATLACLDHLSALTLAPDDGFDELQSLFTGDPRLRVPPVVFNAVLNIPQTV